MIFSPFDTYVNRLDHLNKSPSFIGQLPQTFMHTSLLPILPLTYGIYFPPNLRLSTLLMSFRQLLKIHIHQDPFVTYFSINSKHLWASWPAVKLYVKLYIRSIKNKLWMTQLCFFKAFELKKNFYHYLVLFLSFSFIFYFFFQFRT